MGTPSEIERVFAAHGAGGRKVLMAMPVIGFLDSRSSDTMGSRLNAFRQGLKEVGFTDGENVTIMYRWADNRVDRLPEIAAAKPISRWQPMQR